jgi:hypothetical protein
LLRSRPKVGFFPWGEQCAWPTRRDIEAYLDDRNANPKPYKWRARGAAIFEKSAVPVPPSTKRALDELLVAN